MRKNISVTIGIPAYNEENNIDKLLNDILKQDELSYHVKSIIIASDGSTDQTVKKVRSFKDNRIKLLDYLERKGVARCFNQIINLTDSDILILLDADIRIPDVSFLKKLIKPIADSCVDLTSSHIEELHPRTFFEYILYVSMLLKTVLFTSFNNGNNIYTCHGIARAFSKRFYKKLSFPSSIGNDMYSFLKCMAYNFSFQFAKEAVAQYRLPTNFKDHEKQSLRFTNAINEQNRIFSDFPLKSYTSIPISVYVIAGFRSLPIFIRYPHYVFAYLCVSSALKFSRSDRYERHKWEIVGSSKSV